MQMAFIIKQIAIIILLISWMIELILIHAVMIIKGMDGDMSALRVIMITARMLTIIWLFSMEALLAFNSLMVLL